MWYRYCTSNCSAGAVLPGNTVGCLKSVASLMWPAAASAVARNKDNGVALDALPTSQVHNQTSTQGLLAMVCMWNVQGRRGRGGLPLAVSSHCHPPYFAAHLFSAYLG